MNDTPYRVSSHHSQRSMSAAASKHGVAAELSGNVTANLKTDSDSIYQSYDDPGIEAFIQSCGLYKKETWTEVNRIGRRKQFHEKDLYPPFADIIDAILTRFHTDNAHPRQLVDTHKANMKHLEDKTTYVEIQADGTAKILQNVKTSPDLTIFGNGPYFTEGDDEFQYNRCVAPVEIKRDKDLNMSDVTVQLGVYVRSVSFVLFDDS